MENNSEIEPIFQIHPENNKHDVKLNSSFSIYLGEAVESVDISKAILFEPKSSMGFFQMKTGDPEIVKNLSLFDNKNKRILCYPENILVPNCYYSITIKSEGIILKDKLKIKTTKWIFNTESLVPIKILVKKILKSKRKQFLLQEKKVCTGNYCVNYVQNFLVIHVIFKV